MTPHKQMTKWDSEGQAYVIRHLRFVNGGTAGPNIEVLEHSERWINIRIEGGHDWINLDHVLTLRLEVI